MRAATGGAMARRPDGIVIIDPDKAAGQPDIVSACPYGTVFWNEASNLPQICTFCAHLLDAGHKPRELRVHTGADPKVGKSKLSGNRGRTPF